MLYTALISLTIYRALMMAYSMGKYSQTVSFVMLNIKIRIVLLTTKMKFHFS